MIESYQNSSFQTIEELIEDRINVAEFEDSTVPLLDMWKFKKSKRGIRYDKNYVHIGWLV